MAVVNVSTYIESLCTYCGFWSRTHYEYMTCNACGEQTVKRTEFIEAGVEPDALVCDGVPF